MSFSTSSPDLSAEPAPSDLYAIVPAPDNIGELQLRGGGLVADQDGDTDSTDTWCSRDSSVSSASGRALAEAVRSSSVLPSIGDIAVESSSEVYIGSNTHFHGAVTLLVHPNTLPALLPAAVQSARALKQDEDEKQDEEQDEKQGEKQDDNQRDQDPSPPPSWKQRWLQRLARVAKPMLGFTVVSCIAIFVVLFRVHVSQDKDKNVTTRSIVTTSAYTPTLAPSPAPHTSSTSVTDSASTTVTTPLPDFVLVSREDWGASPRVGHIASLRGPVDYLIVQHTVQVPCHTEEDCAARVRDVQSYAINYKNWADIAYNFLVGGDGSVYEGRGWSLVGAHTTPWNDKSIGVGLIGNFINEPPPNADQGRALNALAKQGVLLRVLSADFKLVGACQLKSTTSPGETALSWLRTLEHWSNFTTDTAQCQLSTAP